MRLGRPVNKEVLECIHEALGLYITGEWKSFVDKFLRRSAVVKNGRRIGSYGLEALHSNPEVDRKRRRQWLDRTLISSTSP